MPETISSFKAAFRKIITGAESQVDETGLPLPSEALADARKRAEDAWGEQKVDEWPKKHQQLLVAVRNEAQEATGKRGVAIYDALSDQIARIGSQRKESEKLRKSTQLKAKHKDTIVNAFPLKEERTPEQAKRYQALMDEANRARSVYAEARLLHDAGDYQRAIRLFQESDDIAGAVLVKASLEQFAESQTVVMDQGTFSRPNSDRALLLDLDMGGVCQAMVLDFLHGGGSKQEPGSPVEGQITDKHIRMQNTYAIGKKVNELLEKTLQTASQNAEEELRRQQQTLTTKEQALEYADRQLELAEQKITEIENVTLPLVKNQGKELVETYKRVEIELRMATAQIPRDFSDRDYILGRVQTRFDTSKRLHDEWVERVKSSENRLAEWQEYQQKMEEYRRRVETEKSQAIEELNKARSEAMRLGAAHNQMLKDISELAKRTRDLSGPPLPSQMLEAYGVSVRPESTSSKKPEGEYLTKEEVVGEVMLHLGSVEDNTTASFQISCAIEKSAHAIALRATRATSDTDNWEIEFFDPNGGGFKYDKPADFQNFLGKFYETVYGKWLSMSVSRLDVQTQDTGEDVQSVTGPSVAKAWELDWGQIENSDKTLGSLETMSKNALDARWRPAVEKIRSVFPVDTPEQANQTDLLVARTYIERALEIAEQLLKEQNEYDDEHEKVRQNLVKADDTVRELHAAAVSLHHDGDLVGATAKMKDAVDALAKLIQSEPKKSQRGDLTQAVPENWDAEELDANGLFDSLCDTHKELLGGTLPTQLEGPTFQIVSKQEIAEAYAPIMWDPNEGPWDPNNVTCKEIIDYVRDEMCPDALCLPPSKDPKRPIFVQVEKYTGVEGEPDYLKARAVMMHESHHASSSGFVNTFFFDNDQRASWILDECATEHFTKKAWDAKYSDPEEQAAYFRGSNYFVNAKAKTGWYGELGRKIFGGGTVSEATFAKAYFLGDPEALEEMKQKTNEIREVIKPAI